MRKAILLFAGLAAMPLLSAPLTLVKDGKAVAAIVVAADKPSRAAQLAAFEIQSHVKLITGAELPIVDDKRSVEGAKVLVGDSAATRALGVKRGDFKDEEYMVRNAPGAIVLVGNDTYDGWRVDYQNSGTFPFSYHYAPINNATLWAAYDFLEKGCDVRHYAPGDLGTTFTPRSTLTVDMADCRRKPALDAFRMVYSPEIFYERGKAFGKRDSWLLKLRWRNTERFGMCNHNVYSLLYKYYKRAFHSPYKEAFVASHPEYFAQGFAGKSSQFLMPDKVRQEYPGDADLPPQPCLTNPAVIEHFAQEAVAAQKGEFAVGSNQRPRGLPGTPYYYPIELDDNDAVCQCANCRKMFPDKPQSERAGYLKLRWASEIAKRAAQLNPQVGVATLVYGHAFLYPKGLELAPNLAVQLCVQPSNWWHPETCEKQRGQVYRPWVESGRRLVTLWTYLFGPGYAAKLVYKYDDYFPGFYASKLGALFKEFAADGVRGWVAETQGEFGMPFWGEQLELYAASRLADDPALDIDKLVEEFFVRYYGAAAKPMREFYRIVEDAYWNPANYPGTFPAGSSAAFYTEEIVWGKLGTKERMDKLGALMAEAERLAQTPEEKRRLALFDTGLWQSMLRGRRNYEAKEKFRALPVPELAVPRVAAAGGDPAKADWAKAVSADWRAVNGFPVKPGRTLRLAHDGDFLYVEYFEPGDATKLKVEGAPWVGDDVEFFFAAGTERPYHQFAANPAGKFVALGYYYTNMVNFDGKWDSGAKVESHVGADGWTLRAAFPLAKLLPDGGLKPGANFHANFFRSSPGQLGLAWSPIFAMGFHSLDRMGKLKLTP